MKYRVYVKEIWIQPYIVEANSKAHAKNLVDISRKQGGHNAYKETSGLRLWGAIGSENWEVKEIK